MSTETQIPLTLHTYQSQKFTTQASLDEPKAYKKGKETYKDSLHHFPSKISPSTNYSIQRMPYYWKRSLSLLDRFPYPNLIPMSHLARMPTSTFPYLPSITRFQTNFPNLNLTFLGIENKHKDRLNNVLLINVNLPLLKYITFSSQWSSMEPLFHSIP